MSKGAEEIGKHIGEYEGGLVSVSPVIRFGPTVAAEGVKLLGDPSQDPEWVLVYLLDPDGGIAHQWVLPTVEEDGS